MDIWEADKLLLFIAFVVPGFISLKAYALLCPSDSKNSGEQLIDAVAYSSINYALLLWPIYQIETHKFRESHPTTYILFYVFVLLIAPVSWACLLRKIRSTKFVQRSLPHPTGKPWDYVFSQRKPYWVIVTMKDGKQIAGRYDEKAFASSAPAAEQLYLEEAWVLNTDGGFDRRRNDTAGILILAPEIATVELFNINSGVENDEREQERQQGPCAEGLPASEAAG